MKLFDWSWSIYGWKWIPKKTRHSVAFHYWEWLGFTFKIRSF